MLLLKIQQTAQIYYSYRKRKEISNNVRRKYSSLKQVKVKLGGQLIRDT